jgi:hypothetical protein
MVIDTNGNVGVGTSAPAHKLEVAGTTKAEQYLLDAVAKDISDTAVDVFIYDTRKDSDGGAWRKRTQHTSWYNETLNTATRGARKEFPAVAVIVVHQLTSTGKVTIYDGDDPDMPMWMVLNGNAEATDLIPSFSTTSLSCVSALNGIIFVGNGTYDIDSINLIEDAGYKWSVGNYKYRGNIQQRSAGLGFGPSFGPGIANRAVNDVAMTVLPNAPIDAATGLPVPTIAVATDGGVSVIKDNGTVVDYVGSSQGSDAPVDKISFIGSSKLLFSHRYASEVVNLVSSDNSAAYYNQLSSFTGRITNSISHDDDIHVSALSSDDNIESIALNEEDAASKSVSGLSLANHYQVTSDPDRIGCYITSDYNTGWMNGDIKLATLSDTDDTDATGAELVTNGDFSSALGGEWDLSTGSGTIAIISGQLEITQGGYSSVMYAAQDFVTVSGKTYTLSFKVVATTEANYFRVKVGTSANATDLGVTSTLTAAGEYSITFTATGSTSWVTLHSDQNANKKTTWDNISVRLAEEDRSVNGKGLQVFGTVTKNPVATGADLAAYSGFSSSNLLRQPYTSDMDFGTGDICVNLWAKHVHPGGNLAYYFFDKADTDGTNRCGAYYIPNSGVIDFYTPSGTARANSVSLNNWSMITFIRSGTISYVYINGELRGTQTGVTENLTSSDQTGTFVIGTRFNGAEPWQVGDLSLVRVSAAAPSPEQIKKIYEDEKVLFQENAQATLYGSSDAVTALAHDDSTELLHVGTSAGRSVFQGLRRVDNTTTAVSAAISASNNLVGEQ